MGTLYLVATPIGNLEDMTPRAVRILKEAVLIAAEDTRHTGKLLKHFGIETPMRSYFEHNKLSRLEGILDTLHEGDVALVSDAGTPAINDPGYELVKAALEAGHRVIPVPGASAPIAALAVSGLPTDSFLYLGYLPRTSSERRRLLRQLRNVPYTLIFLESPYRLLESLEEMVEDMGDRRILVAREMTKMFEEYWRGTIQKAIDYFHTQPIRGEVTLVVQGMPRDLIPKWTEARLLAEIQKMLEDGWPASGIAGDLAEQSGWMKREIYDLITHLKDDQP